MEQKEVVILVLGSVPNLCAFVWLIATMRANQRSNDDACKSNADAIKILTVIVGHHETSIAVLERVDSDRRDRRADDQP